MEGPPVRIGAGLALAAALLAAAPVAAQSRHKPECTVCRDDAELLARNGIGHGPFPFGRTSTEAIEREFLWRPVWIETEHVRIGAELETWKVPEEERKAYRAELEQLALKWPEIDPKKTTLDPWLRAHLLADRVQRFTAQFLALVGARDEDFLDPERNRMRAVGRHFGEQEKYEVMLFRARSLYQEYMRRTWALPYVKPQRWNNVDRDCMWFGMSQEAEHVRHDQHVHNFVRHNLAHNFLDGYLHYSYDLPVWLTEGFAHWAEQTNDPRFNMFDTVEGSFHEAKAVSDWGAEVRKIVAGGEAVPFSQLLRWLSFAELTFPSHLVCWSKFDFLVRHDPAKLGALITALKSRRNAEGLPDGSHLDDAQRDGFRDLYGWTLQQAEDRWKEWVLATYPAK